MTMNFRTPSYLLGACALMLLTTAAPAQSFDAGQVSRNAALQASPRYAEISGQARSSSGTLSMHHRTTRLHAGLASSPRGLEENQILRGARLLDEPARKPSPLSPALAHQGLASTPRQVEVLRAHQPPGAAEAPTESFQIAPLK